jgi:hypothetical protein
MAVETMNDEWRRMVRGKGKPCASDQRKQDCQRGEPLNAHGTFLSIAHVRHIARWQARDWKLLAA